MKGTGIVILFTLPFYGFTIIDASQLTYRSKTLGGARYFGKIPAPEAVVLSDTGCGGLCQELLLEDRVRHVEVARLGLTTKTGVNPPARLEKIAGREQCEAAVERATPPEDLDLDATGLVTLDPRFQGAVAVDACIIFTIIADLTAPVVVHSWPKHGRHVPFYLGNSDIEHHQIYRRGANLEIAELLAESESGWVEVVGFPPRIRISEPPEQALSFSVRMSYEAPPLSELVGRTLSLDINGRLDFPPAAAPQLIANLRQGDETTRIAAATALRDLISRSARAGSDEARSGAPDSAAGAQSMPLETAWIAPLMAALADPNPSVRSAAAQAIGVYGPAAEAAVPALVGALGDNGKGVADQARAALSRIGAGAVRPLIAALGRADGDIRIGAVRALGAIGPGAQAAGPALLKLLDQETGGLRAAAAWALGKLRWREAVPHLLSAIEHPDGELQDSAKFALSHMGDAAVPGLIDKLAHDDPGVRLRVADALGAIGPAARDALPALRAAMGPKPEVNYLWAVEKIEGKRQAP